ncbi:MAG TPA: Uma2 family endonuclease [Bryobacteraceae bacterium]|nr:Uma2 family endonuclease [Bryobacteraceae bacterium]
MATATTLLTLEEFIARPEREDDQKEELIEGELIVSPGAKVSHADVVRRLHRALLAVEESGFVISNDFSCILRPRSMPIPDLAVVRRERWERAAREDSWLENAPELVIEVVSPSNRKLHVKAAAYLEHGAEQVWIVNPKTRRITVCTSDDSVEARLGETVTFHGVSVAVGDVFPDLSTESLR